MADVNRDENYDEHVGLETQPVTDRGFGPEAGSVCVFCPVSRFVGEQVGCGREFLSRVIGLISRFRRSAGGAENDLGNDGDVIAAEKYVGPVTGKIPAYTPPRVSNVASDFDPYKTPYSSWNRKMS